MRYVCLSLICCLVTTAAEAQDWATAMFDHTTHDFGIVAKLAKVEHHFPLQNIYAEDVHIVSVQSSCSCTVPELTKDLLKSGEKAEVIARIDTRTFNGRREATVRVTIDKPVPAEVQLHVYCYIRSDMVVEPGEINFGTVDRGSTASRKVLVSYAGRPNWKILDVQSAQEHLSAKIAQLNRGLGQVTYELTIELRNDMPAGYLKDYVILVTNDVNPDAARVPIAVEGLVLAPLSVKPAFFSVGAVRPTEIATKHLVIQGKVPFRILSVAVPDERFQAKYPSLPGVVQSVAVTFKGDNKPGEVVGELQIRTDLPTGETLKVPVQGEVLGKDGRPVAPKPGAAAGLGDKTSDGWRPVSP
jgi:hypothetical protein